MSTSPLLHVLNGVLFISTKTGKNTDLLSLVAYTRQQRDEADKNDEFAAQSRAEVRRAERQLRQAVMLGEGTSYFRADIQTLEKNIISFERFSQQAHEQVTQAEKLVDDYEAKKISQADADYLLTATKNLTTELENLCTKF